MTTVICRCHGGGARGDARRLRDTVSSSGGARRPTNVSPLIPFFFIFQRAAFSIKPGVAGPFKTSPDPPARAFCTALQSGRNKKLTSGLAPGGGGVVIRLSFSFIQMIPTFPPPLLLVHAGTFQQSGIPHSSSGRWGDAPPVPGPS